MLFRDSVVCFLSLEYSSMTGYNGVVAFLVTNRVAGLPRLSLGSIRLGISKCFFDFAYSFLRLSELSTLSKSSLLFLGVLELECLLSFEYCLGTCSSGGLKLKLVLFKTLGLALGDAL